MEPTQVVVIPYSMYLLQQDAVLNMLCAMFAAGIGVGIVWGIVALFSRKTAQADWFTIAMIASFIGSTASAWWRMQYG